MAASSAAILIALVLLLALAMLVALVRWLGSKRRRTADRVARATTGVDVVRSAPANCLGIRSKGKWQNRGNGTLVLTTTTLLFEPFVGSNRVHQPLDTIVAVDTVRSFLGKSVFRDLLWVEWMATDGTTDSAAWLVGDLAEWQQALRR